MREGWKQKGERNGTFANEMSFPSGSIAFVDRGFVDFSDKKKITFPDWLFAKMMMSLCLFGANYR